MAQKEIEVILFRQLASCLAMPILIVDPAGTLLFYNEPAESILGMRFEETGEIPAGDWIRTFRLTEIDGTPIPHDEGPIQITLRERRPLHKELLGIGRDGVQRHVAVTTFPLIGQSDRYLGVVSVFWEARR